MNKPVILCVDDEKDILDKLTNLLINEFVNEYDIEIAESGTDALEIFEECREENTDIALVIADYIMPGMKGDELLITLHKKAPDMIKIMLTGQATLQGVANAFEHANLYRYLAKPWEKQDFIQTIRTALQSYKADKSLQEMFEKVKISEEKYRNIFMNAVEGLFQTTYDGKILVANPALVKTLGYESVDDIISGITNVKQICCNPDEWNNFLEQLRSTGDTIEFETTFYTKDKRIIWVAIAANPKHDKAGNIIRIDGYLRDITEEKKAQDKIAEYQAHLESLVEERTRKITAGIKYAARIQKAILPDHEAIDTHVTDYFILWQPRDIVGGDLYWFKKVRHGYFIGVIDCTGHGVPGAFMTMMARSILDHIISYICSDDPAIILNQLNILIKHLLNRNDKNIFADDGMDAGICFVKPDEREVIYAGALIPLIYLKNHELYEIRGDHQSLGYKISKIDFQYTNHIIPLQGNEKFYLTTDGLIEQPGEKNRFGFGRRRLKELIAGIYTKPMKEQEAAIQEALSEYRGILPRRDDITIIGFSI